MTNEEAIKTLKANYPDACYGQLREAVDAAIKALETLVKSDVNDEDRTEDDQISRAAAIDAFKPYADYESNRTNADWVRRIELVLHDLPSAQPEPCEDAVSREEAKWVVFCNRDHVEDQANAIDALPPVTPKAEQPDLSEYSDKLWKAAYERGKAEALDEIVRCKECKYNSNTCGNYVNCDIIPQMFGRTVDNFCSMAERRTDVDANT